IGDRSGEEEECGVVRCSGRTGMLLNGVVWQVIAAEPEGMSLDEVWLGFLFSEVPEVRAQLADAGWSTTGLAAEEIAALRNETAARTNQADIVLASRGVLWPGSTSLRF